MLSWLNPQIDDGSKGSVNAIKEISPQGGGAESSHESNETMKKTIQTLQEFSIPLILGVICAMLWANLSPDSYSALVHTPVYLLGTIFNHAGGHGAVHAAGWDHYLTLHFLVNDIFMALFFGIAAKEITEACLPNGALNPVSKAINPLFGTVGGVVGPIGVFLGLNAVFGTSVWANGWGVPTATDIALAWLVIKFLFGARHPAVSFLLLLAVADDAIGLGIIAIGYPDPNHPTQWMNLLWCLPGIGIAYGLRLNKVMNWVPYIAIGGAFCWWGLYSAHLHPALALVFVVPFLPGPKHDLGLFVDDEDYSEGHHHSPLEQFEHSLKLFVDFGLFFFALVNAGVSFGEINGLSWIVVAALIVGKIVGITGFSAFAAKIGFPLPAGMNTGHLVVTSAVAGLGLTVALFVCGQAFVDPSLQAAAKMGAVFSVGAAGVAFALKKLLNVQDDVAVASEGVETHPDLVAEGALEALSSAMEAVDEALASGRLKELPAGSDSSH
ncbi:Sodium/proton antiporter NhaA [Fuerstiella marisgermanici]|uniref:Sodium/proton antiporter NhaA n=1 Tax=Fuerstiella marisgermanici TaxID=1891926 RepID=A0A1P8WM41_9PLAN|nr:Sodium/proton antiporter NhaA [Fuerstiella marisgermanici]